MNTEQLETEDIELRIEFGLHESCMQGRDGYYSGIRPNHWIPGRDYTFIGQANNEDRNLLKPGEKCNATLKGVIATQEKWGQIPVSSNVSENWYLTQVLPYDPGFTSQLHYYFGHFHLV